VLLSILEPGDEVVLTDPTCAGLINRVLLAGGVPKFARLVQEPSRHRTSTVPYALN
jgi:aspartate/methionine/tyrosine aminotransferase